MDLNSEILIQNYKLLILLKLIMFYILIGLKSGRQICWL